MEWKLGRPSVVKEEINKDCATCPSACCGPLIDMIISNEEAALLRSAGTILFPKVPIGNTELTLYSLESKCGFVELKDGIEQCRIHEDPRRPIVCAEFPSGGEICKIIKESRSKGMGYEFGY